jgi:hypothetical protein
MKKVFSPLLILFILLSCLIKVEAQTQTYTWSGGGGSMNTAFGSGSNWIGSTAPPQNSTATVIIFNGSATVDIGTINASTFLKSIVVNSGVVVFDNTAVSAKEILLDGALTIASGATFRLDGGRKIKLTQFSTTSSAAISGTLDFAGTGGSSDNIQFQCYSLSGPWVVKNGGKILLSGTNAVTNGATKNNLKFEAGATLEITRNGGTLPDADYQINSTILIGGLGVDGVAINVNLDAANYNGNIIWDRANTDNPTWGQNIASFNGTFFMKQGRLTIGGSNAGSFPTRLQDGRFTINNLTITGGVFRIAVNGTKGIAIFDPAGNDPASGITSINNLTVSGTGTFGLCRSDYNRNNTVTINNQFQLLAGGTIDIAAGSGTGILKVAGANGITDVGSTLTKSGSSIDSKFVFNGNTLQNYSFNGIVSGTDLSFEVDNTSSDVNLLSSLTVPKDLILTKGNLILGGNNLTVNNLATGGSLASHVVTNGTGNLTIKAVGTAGKDFPVGIAPTSYDLVNIKNTTGTEDFKVTVGSSVTAGVPSSYISIIPRQWDILSASAGATLAFKPGVGTVGSAQIGHFTGGVWVFTPSTTSAPTYTGTFTSFSPFIIASQVLPVELVSFTAKKVGTINVLNWQTASEKNNSHFDIERSINGENNWTSIGTVKGNGNSVITQNYNFTDNTPLSISYYRLKQIDFDGRFEYSNVVSVIGKSSKFNIASIAPNPTKESSNILLESATNETVSVTLFDVSGRVVLSQNASITEGPNFLTLNMMQLNNGIYFMTIRNKDAVLNQRIIKQ